MGSIPEYTIPVDTGCTGAKKKGYVGKCITCPLPQCLEDSVICVGRPSATRSRNRLIRQRYLTGEKIKSLSSEYGIAPSKINRIVGIY